VTLEHWNITENSITYLIQPEFTANWLYEEIDEIGHEFISGAFWRDEEKKSFNF
jgi:hypothetical protein